MGPSKGRVTDTELEDVEQPREELTQGSLTPGPTSGSAGRDASDQAPARGLLTPGEASPSEAPGRLRDPPQRPTLGQELEPPPAPQGTFPWFSVSAANQGRNRPRKFHLLGSSLGQEPESLYFNRLLKMRSVFLPVCA